MGVGRRLGLVTLLFLALSTNAPIAGPTDWDAPRAKLVNNLKNQGRYTNNTVSAVSEAGKFVVYYAASDYKSHVWLANTETGRQRRLTKSYNGRPLAMKGPKYIYSPFSGRLPEITPDDRYVAFSSTY